MIVQRGVRDGSHADGAFLLLRVRLERQACDGILAHVLGRLEPPAWDLHRVPRLSRAHLLVQQLHSLGNLRRPCKPMGRFANICTRAANTFCSKIFLHACGLEVACVSVLCVDHPVARATNTYITDLVFSVGHTDMYEVDTSPLYSRHLAASSDGMVCTTASHRSIAPQHRAAASRRSIAPQHRAAASHRSIAPQH